MKKDNMDQLLLNNIRKLDLNGEEILLDPKRLQFNDATLSQFMEELSIWYDYYSSKSAFAEELMGNAEIALETLRAEKFLEGKTEAGLSDKGAEAFTTKDPMVKAAAQLVTKYKSDVKQLKEYLRAMDKSHQMAQNRGYMLRKEMDKLMSDIHYKKAECNIDDIIAQVGS